jgi:hypothetical protein
MEKIALLTQNLLLLQKILFVENGTVKYALNAQREHILIRKEIVKELVIIVILGIREVEIV